MPSWLPSSVKSVICSKLETELDRVTKAIQGIRSAMVADIESIENLFNLPFRTLEDTMTDVNNMLQGLDSVVPNIHDLSSITSIVLFLERCVYLKDHPLINNAYKMAQQLLDEYQAMGNDYIQDYIDLIPSNVLNTFDIGNKLLGYKDKLNKYKISEKQADANNILICMNAICKLDESDNVIPEVQSYINTKTALLESLQTQMRFTSDGSIDLNRIYTNAGINTDEKLIMNNTIDAVEHVKETFTESQKNLEAATNGDTLPYPSTSLYTHYNTPTFFSSSALFDTIDPSNMYSSDYLDTWESIQLPTGTTTKQGTLDVKIEIDECEITETPEPNINCFSTYNATVKIIIGFSDCRLSGDFDTTTTTVTQVNHGYSTGAIIIISDATSDILEGNHTITVVNDHVYTFTSTFNGLEDAKASSLFKSAEGEYEIGMPVCGTCGKYIRYGIGSASNEDLYYIRKNMSEAVKNSIEKTMALFSASEVEALISNR